MTLYNTTCLKIEFLEPNFMVLNTRRVSQFNLTGILQLNIVFKTYLSNGNLDNSITNQVCATITHYNLSMKSRTIFCS